MKNVLIHHRSPHHAINSGYSRILDYLTMATVIGGNTKFPYRLAKLISDNSNQRWGSYDSLSVRKEIALFIYLIQNKKEAKCVHYLNAERDIRRLIRWKKYFKNTFFCGTFHKSPEILKRQITAPKYLKNLDGAIAVGINQVAFLKEWLQTEKVEYIPHGVDTFFFRPLETFKSGRRILFVGQYLRDFDTFNRVIQILLEKFSDIKVDVVIRKEFVKCIDTHKNIIVHVGIDDLSLRNFYQKASLLFLPLLDATACNSILEGMACGLPIVTNDVGGNVEYLKETENRCIPRSDIDGFVEAISDLLNNQKRLDLMGISSRKKVLKYDWEIVSRRVMEFYQEIQE